MLLPDKAVTCDLAKMFLRGGLEFIIIPYWLEFMHCKFTFQLHFVYLIVSNFHTGNELLIFITFQILFEFSFEKPKISIPSKQ